MSCSKILRLVLLAPALGAALAARADDAYSNFIPSLVGGFYNVDAQQTIGYQFASGLTGTLTGFTVAIGNNAATGGAQPFTLRLYADSGTNTLGGLLGTYAGLSTGVTAQSATARSVVPATGAAVGLASGAKYWLVASSAQSLGWTRLGNSSVQPGYAANPSPFYANLDSAGFSVQAVPEPVTPAALGLASAALLRRRKAAKAR